MSSLLPDDGCPCHLSSLKQKSIDIHNAWKDSGRPRNGPINQERLRIRALYRKSIKLARTKPIHHTWDTLHSQMIHRDTNGFWNSWKALYNKRPQSSTPYVNGMSSKTGIADSFKSHFMLVSQPNSVERVSELQRSFDNEYGEIQHAHLRNCNCNSYRVTKDTIIDSIFSLKAGKSSDNDHLAAEHFLNAPATLLTRLEYIFNAMLQHGFVPRQFQYGTIIPIIKDQQGNHADMHNYRGITLSPIISKIFEHSLRLLFSEFLTTSRFQFGYKRKSSTTQAVFSLKATIDYYVEKGSNVFCSFLDASKAFDRLVHAGLFSKLMRRGAPIIFLQVIIYWYSNLHCRVRWEDQHSEWFPIKAGVRQGGILSPDFYCLYVDDLIAILQKLKAGCHIKGVFTSALLYADDMALLAPSLKGLQKLLSACGDYCRDWDICLNAKKSRNMYFGKRRTKLSKLKLNKNDIDWAEQWSYLGVDLVSHTKFNCCIEQKLRKFYRSMNSILRVEGRSNDTMMLKLIESHCLPILTYAIETITVCDRDKRRQLRVAYNSIFRRIFGYRNYESVRALQSFLGRLDWEGLVERRTRTFMESVRKDTTLNIFI